MALDDKGIVYTWGLNNYGQLGNETSTTSLTPIVVEDLTNIYKIEAAKESAYAIDEAGVGYAWGLNNYGQLGDGTFNTRYAPVQIQGVTEIADIQASSTYHTLILRLDGTVWGMGNNSSRSLTDVGGAVPERIKASAEGVFANISSISVGAYTSFAISNDNKVYAWGANSNSQLAQGHKRTVNTPTYMKDKEGADISDALVVAGGNGFTVLARTDGTVWTVGKNGYGQLGDGTTVDKENLTYSARPYVYVEENETTINMASPEYQINATQRFGFNILYNEQNDAEIKYTSSNEEVAKVDSNGKVTAIKPGRAYITVEIEEIESKTRITVDVIKEEKVVREKIIAGYSHTIALKQDGTVWTYGANNKGELGNGRFSDVRVLEPEQVTKGIEGKTIIDIAAGYYHSMVLTKEGEVYSFGNNTYGELGIGSKAPEAIATKVEGLENIAKIYAEEYVSIAITKDGELYVWGKGYDTKPSKVNIHLRVVQATEKLILTEDGTVWELGLNNLTRVDGLENIVQIASELYSFYALDANSQVWSWGHNYYGQLGLGHTRTTNEPTKMLNPENNGELTDIVEMAAGKYSILVINKNGEVFGCGNSSYGGTGTGVEEKSRTILSKVEGYENAKNISAAYYHTISTDVDGNVWAWGGNEYGQLGNGGLDNMLKPSIISSEVIKTEPNPAIMSVGEEKQLTSSLNHGFNLIEDIIEKGNISYEVIDSDIAEVTADGKITAKQQGRTVIKASHPRGVISPIFVIVTEDGNIAIPEVEIGDGFMAALKSNGEVWSWGVNNNGQLGLGDKYTKDTPTKVESVKDIIDIATGDSHTVAVDLNGNVYAWGLNEYGQLGNMTADTSYVPVEVLDANGEKLENIVKVAAGGNKSVALDSKGNVWIWGQGNLRYATKIANVKNAIDISAEYAVKANGKVAKLSNGQELQNVSNAVEVSTGFDHTLILSLDGVGYAVGNNTYGQLGVGTGIENTEEPVGIKDSTGVRVLSGIKELKAGKQFSIALLENGEVYVWGSNETYKLAMEEYPEATDEEETNEEAEGEETTEEPEIKGQALPIKNDKFENTLSVFAGLENGAMINTEGYVFTWGAGESGQLGNRLREDSYDLNIVGQDELGLEKYKMNVEVGEEYKLDAYNKTFNVLSDWKKLYDVTFESGNENIATISEDGNITGIKEGYTTITVRKKDTEYVNIMQLSIVPKGIEIEPMAISKGSHTAILKSDGTVWTYGNNTYGQLGDGTTKDKDDPVQVVLPEGVKAKQIAVGEEHTLVVTTDGEVYAFGTNYNSALGIDELTAYSEVPVKLELENISKIAASNYQSIAITEDGNVYVWGQNTNGELGTGSYNNVKVPTRLRDVADIIDVSLGNNHSILLDRNGKVFITGLNSFGQLGLEGESIVNTFKELELEDLIGYISAGDKHTILLTTNGEIYTFGYNKTGQLLNGTLNDVIIPTKVSDINGIMSISAGSGYSMLLNDERKVLYAGINKYGELADGTLSSSYEVAENDQIENVMSISAGNTYSVFIRYDGTVWAAGDYYHGTSDFISKTNSEIPVKLGNDETHLERTELSIGVNENTKLNVVTKFDFNVLYESSIGSDEFTYEVLDNSIAKIDEEGNITGLKVGTTWAKAIEKDTNKELIAILRVGAEGSKNAPKVDGGEEFAVILKNDGSIWSFGSNKDGLLGTTLIELNTLPNNINTLTSYENIAVGKKFALVLRNDGTVWSWGDNTYGQLGLGNTMPAKKPTQIEGLEDIIQIAAGDNHALALDKYGNVYAWGLNDNGRLGTGDTENKLQPVLLTKITDKYITNIAAGSDYTAIVDDKGNVMSFGRENTINDKHIIKAQCMEDGVILLDSSGNIYKAQDENIELIYTNEDIVDISAKGNNALALDNKGNVYVWGENANGELGLGHTEEIETPTKLNNNENTFVLGNGYTSSYSIDKNGFVFSTGDNTNGQLGNGSYDSTLEFKYLGDKKVSIEPSNYELDIYSTETLKVNSNVFNVFNLTERNNTDFIWKSSDDEIAKVTDEGVLRTENYGRVIITAEDKLTGGIANAIRVVVEETDKRVETIKVDETPGKITNIKEYTVDIETKEDYGELYIKSIYLTDLISIDGGLSWSRGSLTTTIPLTTEPQTMEFLMKSEEGITYEYTLIINKTIPDETEETDPEQIPNLELESVLVNNKVATRISDTEYRMELPENTSIAKVVAKTERETAYVSINDSEFITSTTTANINMSEVNEELVKIQVYDKNETKEYTLRIIREQSDLSLEYITVDGEKAIKNGNVYQYYLNTRKSTATVQAKALIETGYVDINGMGAQAKVSTRNVVTAAESNTFIITVTDPQNSDKSKEYTLIINQPSRDTSLNSITVSTEEFNYTAERDEGTNTFRVKIGNRFDFIDVTAITGFYKANVSVNGSQYGVGTRTVTVDVREEPTIIPIVVRSQNGGETEEYSLIVEKLSSNVSLKSVTIDGIKALEKTNEDNAYEISLGYATKSVNIIATAMDELAEVKINDYSFENSVSSHNIDKTETNIVINVTVRAKDKLTTQDYKVYVYGLPDIANITQIKVNGEDAILDSNTNTFVAKVAQNIKNLDISVIPEDLKSKIAYEDEEAVAGILNKTIVKEEDKIEINLTVIAQDETTINTYKLIIENKISNANLMSLRVDGNPVIKDNTGKYTVYAGYNTQEVVVEAITEDKNAKVAINDSEFLVNTNTQKVATLIKETTAIITVEAEDGTVEEYELVIRKLSNTTNLLNVYVDEEPVSKDEDGKFTAKIGNKERVTLKVETEDKLARVDIEGFNEQTNITSYTLDVMEEERIVKVRVIAEDGTIEIHEVVLKKFSSDNTVARLEVDGVEDEDISRISNTTFQVIVPDIMEEANLSITANNEFAQVKIGDNEFMLSKGTAIIPITAKEMEVPFIVKAENGTEQEYKVIIKVEKDLGLAEKPDESGINSSILVDNEPTVLEEDGKYHAYINAFKDSVKLTINTRSPDVLVDIEGQEQQVGSSTFDISTEESEVEVIVKVTDPNKEERFKEYTVVITKKDKNASLESIMVDDRVAALGEDGNYHITVESKNISERKYKVTAIAKSNTSQVMIEDSEYAEKQNSYDLSLTGKTTTATIKVKSESDNVSEYKLIIDQVSTNEELEYIRVNGVNIPITGKLDYKAFVKINLNEVTVEAGTADPYANISIDGGENKVHTASAVVDMTNGIATTQLIVTAENGTQKIYTITLMKESTDASIEIVSVNDTLARIVDGKYVVSTSKELNEIYIRTSNEYATLTIDNVNMNDDEVTVNRTLRDTTLTVNIKVTAQAGNQESYVLELNKMSSNTNIESLKLGGIELTYDEESKSYTKYILDTVETEELEITTEDALTKISVNNDSIVGTHTAQGMIEFTEEITEIPIITTAEDGSTETRTLYVVKQDSNTDLELVSVDGDELEVDADGNYHISILETVESIEVHAKTVKAFAKVDINNSGKAQNNEKTANITSFATKVVEVPITVTATDGTVKVRTLYITRLSVNAGLANMLVNGDPIDFVDEETGYNVKFIDRDATSVNIKITAENEYATITSGENEAVSVLDFEEVINDKDRVVVTFTIVAEDGITKEEHSIYLLRYSNDASINTLKVDGKEVTENDTEGNYYIRVPDTNTKAEIELIANNIYATVELDGTKSDSNTITKEIELSEEKTTTVNVKVVSQDGQSITDKQLVIEKVSADNTIEYIYAGNDLVTLYDEETKTYTAYVRRTASTENFRIKTNNEYATIEIDNMIETGYIELETYISEGDKTIKVTSETGEVAEYTLRIVRKSNNANILELYIDGELMQPDEEDESGLVYKKQIPSLKDIVRITAVPAEPNASIQISEEPINVGETEAFIPLNTNQTIITIPVRIIAQDGETINTYNITLNRLTNNTNIKSLTINDDEIVVNENDEYITYIDDKEDIANLVIELEDPNAEIRIGEDADLVTGILAEQLDISDGKAVTKTIQVIATDGTLKEYTLIINRRMDDLRLENVYVDNRLVNKVDDTTYQIEVLDSKESITIKAISANEEEYVKIADMEEAMQEAIYENYVLNGEREITIPIQVFANDHISSREYKLVIKLVSTIEELSDLGFNITVDGNEVTKDDTGYYIYVVEDFVTKSEVEVTASSKTTKVQIMDGEFVLRKNTKEVEIGEVYVKVPITLESGDGTRREVTLYITKNSTDNSLKEVQADNISYQANEDGTYTVFANQDSSSVDIKAIANMELARVSVNGNKDSRGENQTTIDMVGVNEKTITVLVTAVNGDTKEYTVNILKRGKIVNRIVTDTAEGNEQIATVTVYKTSDTREEDDETDPREVIAQTTTSGDGTYEIHLPEGNYDIVVTKPYYLEHRLTNIEILRNEVRELEEIKIYAGDVNVDGQIELSDLTGVTYNFGKVAENNEIARYDLNEDGMVDVTDREILMRNYNRKDITVEWTPPATEEEKFNFAFPLDLSKGQTYTVTSPYGMRKHPTTGIESKHTGIDLRSDWHIGILAAQEGEVVFAGDNGAFGNAVEIKHVINGEEIYTFYAHLSRIDVKVGDKVERGQQIGLEGGDASDDNPGQSTGHHLHFEVRTKSGYGNDVDPTLYINFKQ